jgi:hypothetical protein
MLMILCCHLTLMSDLHLNNIDVAISILSLLAQKAMLPTPVMHQAQLGMRVTQPPAPRCHGSGSDQGVTT